MDSRMIYSASEKMKGKIHWPRLTDTEWIYFGTKGGINKEIISDIINSHLSTSELYVSSTRENSFASTKQEILTLLDDILGCENFIIWNPSFTEAIEFNRIGVLRCGKSNRLV